MVRKTGEPNVHGKQGSGRACVEGCADKKAETRQVVQGGLKRHT